MTVTLKIPPGADSVAFSNRVEGYRQCDDETFRPYTINERERVAHSRSRGWLPAATHRMTANGSIVPIATTPTVAPVKPIAASRPVAPARRGWTAGKSEAEIDKEFAAIKARIERRANAESEHARNVEAAKYLTAATGHRIETPPVPSDDDMDAVALLIAAVEPKLPDPNRPVRNQEVDNVPAKKRKPGEPEQAEKDAIERLLESVRPKRRDDPIRGPLRRDGPACSASDEERAAALLIAAGKGEF